MGNFKQIFKNISYTLSSNLLTLIVSVVITLFLPKLLGVEEYGYYQLYLFYVSYVGFLHFGWCDGIYLQYGGQHYSDLDKSKFKGQLYSLVISQIIISLIFGIAVTISDITPLQKELVIYFTILNILILNVRTFIVYVLQATNRMKDYSVVTISDRLIFVILVLILLVLGVKSVTPYIVADVLSKFISLVIAVSKVKEISSITSVYKPAWNFDESKQNILIGINLMFANIASTLIIGIVRFGIQNHWNIATFGKISLALSVSNMLMVFINAISLAIFPLLKRVSNEKYSEIYPYLRTFIMPVVLVLLVSYYPISFILTKWLPNYSESMKYMGILFPIVVFEGKVGLITNTYLKALRKEREIFIVNFFSALLSLITTAITIYILDSLMMVILTIPLLLGFRSLFAEIVLSKHLNVSVAKDMILEIIMVICFICFSMLMNPMLGLICYVLCIVIYLVVKKKDIQNLVLYIKTNK